MCDENTVDDNNKFLSDDSNQAGLSRRKLGGVLAGATMAALLPTPANALSVIDHEINVKTPDGAADCYFVHPETGQHPAVIVWPDIVGLRPAFRAMGKRLAQSGYSVLVVNPYYRKTRAPVVGPGASFQDEETRNILLPLARSLSAQTNVTDAEAFVRFLDHQRSVDKKRKIGTAGYCMGGPMTMRTAAAIPTRIGAGASFHGGRLASDSDDSPHLLVPQMQAAFLFAIASNDDERDPNAKNKLKKAYADANLPAEIEVYKDALHGWCPPDSRVHNPEQAERAWSRLLALFSQNL